MKMDLGSTAGHGAEGRGSRREVLGVLMRRHLRSQHISDSGTYLTAFFVKEGWEGLGR